MLNTNTGEKASNSNDNNANNSILKFNRTSKAKVPKKSTFLDFVCTKQLIDSDESLNLSRCYWLLNFKRSVKQQHKENVQEKDFLHFKKASGKAKLAQNVFFKKCETLV